MSFLKNKVNAVFSAIVLLLTLVVVVQAAVSGSMLSVSDATADTAEMSRINPSFRNMSEDSGIILTTDTATQAPSATAAAKTKTEQTTAAPTTAVLTTAAPTTAVPTATQEATVAWATAIPADEPADYNEQWAAGYLVAIDNPDKTYECAQVTLTDEDRDLLERLCYGEFGTGGFIGAALIAQAVKDAMCFDGYTSVQDVITYCRYDGKTTMGTSEACKQAVAYIFDRNHDAVQHRIMYMYNPLLVQSSFHESQNYILTYEDVRFFDRWNY